MWRRIPNLVRIAPVKHLFNSVGILIICQIRAIGIPLEATTTICGSGSIQVGLLEARY